MPRHRSRRALGGPGVVLVVAYGVLALAATGRSVLQVLSYFDRAPLAYVLSAVAAVVYVLATWCLARGGRWVRVGIVACTVELVGVLTVGTASLPRARRLPRPHRVVALRAGLRLRAARAPRPRAAVVPAGRAGRVGPTTT